MAKEAEAISSDVSRTNLQVRAAALAAALCFGVGLLASLAVGVLGSGAGVLVLGFVGVAFLVILPIGGAALVYRLCAPLTRRLAEVREFAGSLAHKSLDARLPTEAPELLDGAGHALNAMADRLQNQLRRLHKMAYSDIATGLPNHERFSNEVSEALAASNLAVLAVIRLERLHRVYDAFGQEAGDEILSRVVSRLRVAVRSIDRLVRVGAADAPPSLVARLRGGEFAVLATNLNSHEDAGRYAQLLVATMNQPFEWRDSKLVVNAVLGASLLPNDGDTADTAIRHAMLALGASRAETGRVRFFSKSLDREAAAQIQFEREMRTAVERNEFQPHFQPKVDLMSGRLVGAEALARWVKGDRTMVSPGKFIPIAEENGMIGAISEQILRHAIWKAAGWARDGYPLSVAINISPLQFADERFADKILRIMEEAGASPDRIELEITESMALDNPERAQRLLQPLRNRGVKIALDDFGCGHSSLASLTRLPFDIIKIDQQFVRGLSQDRHAPAIIETILAMAASLNYEVVAEGIETEREADFLRRRGCMIGQGFLFGAAMPAQEFLTYAESRSTRTLGGAAGAA